MRANTFDADGHPVGFEDRVAFEKVDRIKHQSWLASLLAGEFVVPEKGGEAEAEGEPRTLKWAGIELLSIAEGEILQMLLLNECPVYRQKATFTLHAG